MAQLTARKFVFYKATAVSPHATKTYLSHRELEGGLFPHPSNAVHPTLTTTSLFTLLNTSHRIPMDYFNNTDSASFYPSSFASSELDAYPFFGQISTTKDFDVQAYNAFASCWGMTEIPSLPIGVQETADHGKHRCHLFVESCLTSEFQWFGTHRTSPRPMAVVNHSPPAIIGRWLVTRPNPTAPIPGTRMILPPPRWRQNHSLRSQPPVVVRTSLWKF